MRPNSPMILGLASLLCGCPIITDDLAQSKVQGGLSVEEIREEVQELAQEPSCNCEVDTQPLEEQLSVLEQEVTTLQLELAATRQDQASLEQVLADLQQSHAALSDQVTTQAVTTSEIEVRVETLEDGDASTLVLSSYEVNCNSTWIYNNTGEYQCVVVNGVDPADVPLVQIFNLREATGSWFEQFSCHYIGAWCEGSANDTVRYQSPGMGIRYDSVSREIFTAPHYRSSEDDTMTRYLVQVLGSRTYSAP